MDNEKVWEYNERMLQDDRKINNIALKAVFIIIIVAIVFVLISTVNVFKKRKNAEAEIEKMRKEKIALIDKKNELANLLDYFQDKSFIEKEARRRLNMQKPGEKEVIVVNNNGGGQIDPVQVNASDPIKNSKDKSGTQDTFSVQDNALYNPLKWFKFIFR